MPDDEADEAPSAEGILRCLQALADEAASLRLPRTTNALYRAQAACAAEATGELAVLMAMPRPANARLH